jgi:hypothetical protein
VWLPTKEKNMSDRASPALKRMEPATKAPVAGSILVFSHSDAVRNLGIYNQFTRADNLKGFSLCFCYVACPDYPNPGYEQCLDLTGDTDSNSRQNKAKEWVMGQCRTYQPPIVLLEANLGLRSGSCVYDGDFLRTFPMAKFALFTSVQSLVDNLNEKLKDSSNFLGAFRSDAGPWVATALEGHSVDVPKILNG